MPEEGKLVELVGVRKAFGDNVVLDGIDVGIGRGEAIVVAGPSGSGKSTMLRCVNGLEGIDAGSISFDGLVVSTRGVGGIPSVFNRDVASAVADAVSSEARRTGDDRGGGTIGFAAIDAERLHAQG